MAKIKDKPNWKFNIDTYIIVLPDEDDTIFGITRFIGVIKHRTIYNRKRMTYVCKCLETGRFKEYSKEYVEKNAKIIDNQVATMLYKSDG